MSKLLRLAAQPRTQSSWFVHPSLIYRYTRVRIRGLRWRFQSFGPHYSSLPFRYTSEIRFRTRDSFAVHRLVFPSSRDLLLLMDWFPASACSARSTNCVASTPVCLLLQKQGGSIRDPRSWRGAGGKDRWRLQQRGWLSGLSLLPRSNGGFKEAAAEKTVKTGKAACDDFGSKHSCASSDRK